MITLYHAPATRSSRFIWSERAPESGRNAPKRDEVPWGRCRGERYAFGVASMFRKGAAATPLAVALLSACLGQERVRSPGATPNQLGDACTAASDCESDLFCDHQYPGGQCLKKCASGADCGPDSVCNRSTCRRACERNADCGRSGYVCAGTAPNTFCDPDEEDHTDEMQKAIEEGRKYGI